MEKEKKPIYKKWWFWVIIILVIAGVAGSGSNITQTSSNEATGSSNVTDTKSQEKFTLVSDEKVTDALGTTYIEGEIKNNTNKSYSYVQVTFNLYDESGAQLGTAMANINNLEPNGTWKYKALGYVTEKVASYKFVEITGW